MTSISSIAFSLTAALAVLAAPANTAAPDFEGSWFLDASASDFGMTPAPDSAATIITRADDRLVLTRKVWASMAGNRTVEFDQATDGEAASASSSLGEEIPSRAWWEGDVLVLEVEVESNVGEIVVTDRMSVTDHDTMVMERTLDVPEMGELEQTQIYRRR